MIFPRQGTIGSYGWHVLSRYLGKSLDPQSPEEKEEEKKGFDNNGFNQYRSDRIALDREIPDTRDPR